MQLGAFSLSLAVKDLEASKAFYIKLGFEEMGGFQCGEGWTILKNGETVIGLFEGMFDKNTLTFNPGWDQNAQQTKTFTDVRDLQKTLKDRQVALDKEVDETTSGPGFCVLFDPDGNPILIDQHR